MRIVACLLDCAATPAFAAVDDYLLAVTHDLPPVAKDALPRIDSKPRQLLAVRGYLRAGAATAARAGAGRRTEIRAYESSQEYRDLLAEIAAVRARFEAANPGYSLYANTTARSLDLQLQRWNSNASVGVIAERLQEAAVRELSAKSYPATPDARATVRFANFLREWRPVPSAAPLAAAGLVAARALARDRLSDHAERADHCAHRSRQGALGVGTAGLGGQARGGDARLAFRRTAAVAERALAL